MTLRWLAPVLLLLGLAACSSAPKKSAPGATGSVVRGHGAALASGGCRDGVSPYAAAKEDPSTRGDYTAGGLYKPGVNDSTPDHVPDVACIPEPLVSDEPRAAYGNKSPYEVLGKKYKVMDDVKGYVERGTASYYGAKFHGRLTSDHEVYDMYAFTAAHKTLPLPSFALVTNLDNGQSVVVRVNDRGPFHDGRVIDLSYAAAVKLGITQRGTGRVEVRALTTDDNKMLAARRKAAGSAAPVAIAAATPEPSRSPSKATPPSDIDRLVQALPATSTVKSAAAGASVKPPATVADTRQASADAVPGRAATSSTASTSTDERWRYRVADSAHPGDADNFDAWMRQQGVSVATGKPATPVAAAPTPGLAQAALGDILLQVASFASRENANRALSQLVSAGIVGASISDIVSGGRTLWRLRVNARDHANANELAGRIAGLGFGRPQIVGN